MTTEGHAVRESLLRSSLRTLFLFKKASRRDFSRGWGLVLNLLLLGFAVVFHLLVALIPVVSPLQFRALHVCLFTIIVLWNYPVSRQLSFVKGLAIDLALIGLALVSLGYVVINHEAIETRIPYVTPVTDVEVYLGIMACLLVMEVTRRVVGLVLPMIVAVVVSYSFLGPASVGSGAMTVQLLVEQMYLVPGGLYGMPTSVSAKYVVLFVVLASLLSVAGLDDLIMQLSHRLVRRSKAALVQLPVLASALMGSLVGSSTANAVATGSVTIPLLKRCGFSPEFAAAIETCASTGGLFLPPVMGAVAFVMSEFTGIPYITIAYHAVVPALLYYCVVAFTVHLHAHRRRLLESMDVDLLSIASSNQSRSVGIQQWFLVLPVALLLYVLIIGKSPMLAASFSILLGLFLSQLRPGLSWRLDFFKRFLSRAALSAADVVPTLVCAGMIVTGIEMSGLDTELVLLVYQYSTSLYIGLLLAALLSIMLGLGMPIIAAYTIQVGIIAPMLAELGLSTLQAHLYLIFFGAASMMTPPVAVTAYAAAGVAGANVLKTSLLAVRLGFVTYVIPFTFALSPALLLVGSPLDVAKALLFTAGGTFAMAAAFEGWLFRNLSWAVRLILLLAGISMLVFHLASS